MPSSRESAAGDYTMQVRDDAASSIPRWRSTAKKPISAPRCWGSAAIVRKGFGRGPEEDAIDHLLVLVSDGRNLFRHGKDHVKVLAVEKLCLAVVGSTRARARD